MKKKIKVICCTFVMLTSSLLTVPTMAVQHNYVLQENESGLQPRTDIKEWRFKVENGNLYKRLYNYSTGRWETDWIFVMSGVEEA